MLTGSGRSPRCSLPVGADCGITPRLVSADSSTAIPTKPLRDASLDVWFAGSKLLMSTLHLVGGATLYNPDKTIDYSKTPASAKYAFTFWAFPRGQWLRMLREYAQVSEYHFRQ